MTATPPESPGGDPPDATRVELHGESHDFSTFTQIGTQVNYRPPLPEQAFRPWTELAVPAGLSNLPRSGLFVGRAHELARLDAALAGLGGVVVQAVHGLGGVGKSTLAARWAAAHASNYTVTWWITAATPGRYRCRAGGPGGRAAAGADRGAAAGGAAGRGGAVAGRPLRAGRRNRTARPSCARSWAFCRWPSNRPAPT
jgi:hypothetical protein